jgi:DNA-binding HxlR family transcriptional regulator
MPARPWTGYRRFCPLSRALDVIGERWTLVIVQELLEQPRRYGSLLDRLPGIGTSVLADRLRRLERAGVVAREPGPVGAGVIYALTPRGRELEEALGALRRWGVGFLADPAATARLSRASTSPTSAASRRSPTGSSSSWSMAGPRPCTSPRASSGKNPAPRPVPSSSCGPAQRSWAAGPAARPAGTTAAPAAR